MTSYSSPNAGEWHLHDEETVKFWVHPTRRTLFTKQIVPRWGMIGARYLTFEYKRTWYSTITRQFEIEVKTLRTFEDELAEGYAIYDWRSKHDFVLPEKTTREVQG